ncbi:hypothetical protein [Desulfoferrobacter suflitae]|uniref:hypothetical protein n=1 Tax=Desulfoferrobacter suflitae TaxID=2865782 RepID=UPI002164D522|nr:hypothetical protein [Desulfoferrobacter suflitae]MCK8600092.1 hypothetical protein [Desulfoferrobacter suflitae]
MITPRKLIRRAMKTMCPTAFGFGLLDAHFAVRCDEESVRLLDALFLLYMREGHPWRQSSYLEWEQKIRNMHGTAKPQRTPGMS